MGDSIMSKRLSFPLLAAGYALLLALSNQSGDSGHTIHS